MRRGGVLWHFDKNIEELSDVALRKLAIQTDGTVFEGTSMEGVKKMATVEGIIL